MDIPLKKSRQRDAILACVISHHDHPTADDIYQELKLTMPALSLGTVYRNLSLLVRIGSLRRITGEDHIDRFDSILSPHAHFSCLSCGCLLDIPLPEDYTKPLFDRLNLPGQVVEESITLKGYCKACLKSH